MANQIHWFPGHMSKALRDVEDKIKFELAKSFNAELRM